MHSNKESKCFLYYVVYGILCDCGTYTEMDKQVAQQMNLSLIKPIKELVWSQVTVVFVKTENMAEVPKVVKQQRISNYFWNGNKMGKKVGNAFVFIII